MFPRSLLPIWGRDDMSDKAERQTGMGGDVGKFSLSVELTRRFTEKYLSSNRLMDPALENHLGSLEIQRKNNQPSR